MNATRFRDRAHAGQLLADQLMPYAGRAGVMILALPRGGVPVACEVANKINVRVDVLVVRKLGVPGWKELAMGAIASGGGRVINHEVVHGSGISMGILETVLSRESEELERRELAFQGHTGFPEVKDRIVIVIDDGMATGSTIKAAVQALRQQAPARIIVAVPTAASDACGMLEPLVDDLLVLKRPDPFRAVSQSYGDFTQISDAEVHHLLAKANAPFQIK